MQIKFFCILTAAILVLSLGIHVFDFNHLHYHVVEDFDAMMHANEQKRLLLLFVAFILVGTFLANSQQNLLSSTPSNRFVFDVVSVFEPTRRALRLGILHPKICG